MRFKVVPGPFKQEKVFS